MIIRGVCALVTRDYEHATGPLLFTGMEDTLQQLLAGLSKPSRRFRHMNVRISDREFMAIQSYAATRYLNYSDVVRAAIAAFLTSADNTKT